MKRYLQINKRDGELKNLEIGKAVSVNTDSEFIFFEKMQDDKWRLTFSKKTVEDFSLVESFVVVREN